MPDVVVVETELVVLEIKLELVDVVNFVEFVKMASELIFVAIVLLVVLSI